MTQVSLAVVLSLLLRFPPIELNHIPGDQPLKSVSVVASSNPVTDYAAGWFQKEIKLLFGMDVTVTSDIEGAEGTIIILSHTKDNPLVRKYAPDLAAKLAGPESYAMRYIRSGNKNIFVVVGADGPGSLYGAQTLADILRATKGILPKTLEASDYPEMKVRAKCGGAHELNEKQLARFDWFARLRLNAIYYEIDGASGQKDVGAYFPKMVKECARRGINLYGCLSQWRTYKFFGKNMNPTIPEHVAYIDNLLEDLSSGGASGLMFLFDDISHAVIEEAASYAKINPELTDLADYQIFWMKRMVRIGRKHGVKSFVMCPTPYHPNLAVGVPDGFDSEGYFRKIGPFCAKNGIRVYHCAVRKSTVEPLLRYGVKDYIWWYNGVRDLRDVAKSSGGKTLPEGYYGLPKLEFGNEMAAWIPGKGVALRKDTLATLQQLPQRTREAWLCGSDRLDWGTYMWRPSRLNLAVNARNGIDAIMGEDSYADYIRWETVVQKWAQRSAQKVTPGKEFSQSRKALKGLERDFTSASEAIKRLKAKKDAPTISEARKRSALSSMNSQLRALGKMLKDLREARPTAHLTSERKRPGKEDGTRLTRWITLANPQVTYACRYVIIQRKKDGTFHRAKWHFGAGLGMKAPSLRNWYDAGFIDVQLDDNSLETTRAEWSEVKTSKGIPAAKGVWKTPWGTVTMLLSATDDKGLRITGHLDKSSKARQMKVILWTLPATGNEEKMSKKITTALRTESAIQIIELNTRGENNIVFYDKNYDVPKAKATGPCALAFKAGGPDRAKIDITNFIVTIRLDYSSKKKFDLVIYDYAACTNAEVLDYYSKNVFKSK